MCDNRLGRTKLQHGHIVRAGNPLQVLEIFDFMGDVMLRAHPATGAPACPPTFKAYLQQVCSNTHCLPQPTSLLTHPCTPSTLQVRTQVRNQCARELSDDEVKTARLVYVSAIAFAAQPIHSRVLATQCGRQLSRLSSSLVLVPSPLTCTCLRHRTSCQH